MFVHDMPDARSRSRWIVVDDGGTSHEETTAGGKHDPTNAVPRRETNHPEGV